MGAVPGAPVAPELRRRAGREGAAAATAIQAAIPQPNRPQTDAHRRSTLQTERHAHGPPGKLASVALASR